MTEWKPVDVECPMCGAEPGDKCQWEGIPVDAPIKWTSYGSHPKRIKRAEEMGYYEGHVGECR